jgi:hypothetical protein
VAKPSQTNGHRRGEWLPYVHLAFSLLLFGMGAFYALTGEARFDLGGDDTSNRRAIHVNAHGVDAVAIGCVFVAIGLVNLANGLRGRARLRAFWAGGALLAATVLYGAVNAVRAILSLFA